MTVYALGACWQQGLSSETLWSCVHVSSKGWRWKRPAELQDQTPVEGALGAPGEAATSCKIPVDPHTRILDVSLDEVVWHKGALLLLPVRAVSPVGPLTEWPPLASYRGAQQTMC